jgi:hypothetical protein
MTHFWHRWYRPLTALALFAMLMAFTGPLISQMQRLMEMPTGAMAGMAHQGDAGSHGHDQPRAIDDAHIVHHFDMAACGYCELFLHTPGIEPPRVMPPLTPPPDELPLLASETSPATAPIYPRYASRAPPRA